LIVPIDLSGSLFAGSGTKRGRHLFYLNLVALLSDLFNFLQRRPAQVNAVEQHPIILNPNKEGKIFCELPPC